MHIEKLLYATLFAFPVTPHYKLVRFLQETEVLGRAQFEAVKELRIKHK